MKATPVEMLGDTSLQGQLNGPEHTVSLTSVCPTVVDSSGWNFPAQLLLLMSLPLVSAGLVGFALAAAFGLPHTYVFTHCPLAFFVLSFLLVGVGGLMGWALLAPPALRQRRLLRVLLAGGIAVGIQTHGLRTMRAHSAGLSFRQRNVATALVAIHEGCALFVLLALAAITAAARASHREPAIRFLLRACAGYWALLGVCWSGLLCLFTALL